MTARIIPFPEIYPPHTPREKPALVLILPVVWVEHEDQLDDRRRRRRREPEFVRADVPLLDGSLSSFRGGDDA